jgi:hypothetical protein
MKTKGLVLLLLIVALIGGVQAAGAAPHPSIITFDSSLSAITVAQAEAGTTTTTLTWMVAGMTDEYRLRLHTYMLDRWDPVFPADSVPLEPAGSRAVTIYHPLNFGPPTFLLSIQHLPSNSVVDQRILTIPYDQSGSAPPRIDLLQTNVESVEAVALQNKTAQIMLSWSVVDRSPTSNLLVEQILADGSAVSVELPRLNLWIPSAAQGPAAPVYEAGASVLLLRLRLIDVVTGTTLDEKGLEIPIAGVATVPPVVSEPPPAAPTVPPSPIPSANSTIVSFVAVPPTVNPGSAVTLTWEVIGTGGVTIEQSVPNVAAVSTVVTAQSPKGSAQVYLPDYAAYSVMFTLKAANGVAQAQVKVHCPYTFFFGDADGCPTGAPFEIGASYQLFENGAMIWRSDTNEVYVHYNDGTAAYFVENDYAALPEVQTDDMPPLDREAPGSGFGKVWANAPGVREKLGWALAGEAGYTTTLQGVALTRDPRPAFAFYFTLPDGSVIGSGFGRWQTMP